MIPAFAAAKLLPWKWIALGCALLALLAWGGLGWYGKATAEREFADYQLEQARVVSGQLAANQRLSDQQALHSAVIDAAYQKGKRDVAQAFQPALADLQMLRALFAGGATAGLRQPGADGAGAVPGPADPPGVPHAVACTDEPRRILDAAYRVVADLAACEDTRRQLISLQAWVKDVCSVH